MIDDPPRHRRASVRERDPLRWVIEAFSVVTGAAFMLSGAINAITFYVAWRINYFLVASPSDVVMSGFIVLTMALLAGGVAALFVALVWLGLNALRRFKVTRLRLSLADLSAAISIVAAFLTLFAAVGPLVRAIQAEQRISRDPIGTGAGRRPLGTGGEPGGQGYGGEPGGTGIDLAADQLSDFSYGSGLRLDLNSTVIPECRSAPVLWMGSSSVVLNCAGRVKVYHSLDGIITERD